MVVGRFIWLAGGAGAVLLATAAGMVACSSSSSGGATPQDSGTSDTATSSGGDTGTKMETGSETASNEDSGSEDAGADCESPPGFFPDSGIYCPYTDAGSVTCLPGQHCCEGPSSTSPPSTCVAGGTACPSGQTIDWQCQEQNDCLVFDAGTGRICCGTGTATTVTSCGNSWTEWTGFTGTRCAATCPAGMVVCQSTADCTATDAGTTCKASKSGGSDFGVCAP